MLAIGKQTRSHVLFFSRFTHQGDERIVLDTEFLQRLRESLKRDTPPFQIDFVTLEKIGDLLKTQPAPTLVFFAGRDFDNDKLEDIEICHKYLRSLDSGVLSFFVTEKTQLSGQEAENLLNAGFNGSISRNFDPKSISDALSDSIVSRLKSHIPDSPQI